MGVSKKRGGIYKVRENVSVGGTGNTSEAVYTVVGREKNLETKTKTNSSMPISNF